jgi:hypothetical protein
MISRSFLSAISALSFCVLISVIPVGYGMAQSSTPLAANKPQKGLFINKSVPPQTAPKDVSTTGAPSNQNAANSNQLAAQPSTQIKIPPVRITIGAQDNRRATPPTIKVSPQDIAKVQKIMELINIGQKSGR